MKNLATKSMMAVLGIISLALLGVIVFGFYHIKNKSIQTSETVKKVEESSNNSILIQTINSAGSKTENELTKLDDLGLSQEKLVNFIESLENLAREMNLSIKILSVDQEAGKGADNPDKIYFKIETSGNWANNMRFLHAIENLPYRILINNSRLASRSANSTPSTGTSTPGQTSVWVLNTDLGVFSFK